MIPIFDIDDPNCEKKLAVVLSDQTNICNRRRPYIGQPHTKSGERGKCEVHGLTIRDISDCIVMGAIDSSFDGSPELYNSLNDDGYATSEILYKIDWDKIDPVAVIQNALCHIEKRMGIYPNVPELSAENAINELFGDENKQ